MQPMISDWLLPRMVARLSGAAPCPAPAPPDAPGVAADRLALIRLIETGGADALLVRDMLALAMSRATVAGDRDPYPQI